MRHIYSDNERKCSRIMTRFTTFWTVIFILCQSSPRQRYNLFAPRRRLHPRRDSVRNLPSQKASSVCKRFSHGIHFLVYLGLVVHTLRRRLAATIVTTTSVSINDQTQAIAAEYSAAEAYEAFIDFFSFALENLRGESRVVSHAGDKVRRVGSQGRKGWLAAAPFVVAAKCWSEGKGGLAWLEPRPLAIHHLQLQ
ncbi:uncharacterized protein J3D65DRAFT_310961 [Phyllosticta citribraziliensis]|uniref:Uncharacterized protein n=1 Tax=Phyllosticta citribraziliensis TaxID=989973 RepID=A0ABR1LY64_9PEZI